MKKKPPENFYRYIVTVLFCLLFSQSLISQTVTGLVTSAEDGMPLPGVNINIKGTNTGSITDLNGKYLIEISGPDNILVFTFTGMEPYEIAVGEKRIIDVIMQTSDESINEVVVIGYGSAKKSDLTGSVSTIKSKELTKVISPNAANALQGKISGVQIISSGNPGSVPQMRIRGTGTVLGGTHVLYVVDGVLTDDITNVNTSDILDMNILKDASASAIYGSRGANGVIIITTKKGSNTEGKLNINYNVNAGIRQASNLVQMANAEEYKNYYQAATGTVLTGPSANTDWYGVILRNAFQQSHNLSISGGTNKAAYFFSGSYLHDQGTVIENEFKRITLRSNLDFNISKNIKVGFQSSYANGINENGFNNLDIDENGNIGGAFNNAYRAAPIIHAKVGDKYGNVSAFNGQVGNPLLDIMNNKVRVAANRLQGAGFIEIKIFPFLSFQSSIGTDMVFRQARKYNYKFLNDETTFDVAGGNQLSSSSYLANKNVQNFKWVWDNF